MMHFPGHYNNWLCGPGSFFHGPLGIILSLLFWGVILYLVVKVLKSIFPSTGASSPTDLDILKKRYARGEISEDAFKRMKAELE